MGQEAKKVGFTDRRKHHNLLGSPCSVVVLWTCAEAVGQEAKRVVSMAWRTTHTAALAAPLGDGSVGVCQWHRCHRVSFLLSLFLSLELAMPYLIISDCRLAVGGLIVLVRVAVAAAAAAVVVLSQLQILLPLAVDFPQTLLRLRSLIRRIGMARARQGLRFFSHTPLLRTCQRGPCAAAYHG